MWSSRPCMIKTATFWGSPRSRETSRKENVHGKPLRLKGQPGEKWPFEMPPQFDHQSLKSGCWIPLIGGEGVMGTLNLFSRRPGNFTDDDVNMLTQIAGQVAIALGNALAFRHI